MSLHRIIDVNVNDNGAITGPVTLSTAKSWLKIAFSDDDSVITDLINEVRQSIEEYCSVSLIGRQVEIIADLWFENTRDSVIEFELPYGPVSGDISEISVYRNTCADTSNSFEAVTMNVDYWFDGSLFYRFMSRTPGRYKFVYVSGWPTDVPTPIITAFKMELTDRYENRGDEVNNDQPAILSNRAKKLVQPYKRMAWL